LKMSDVKIYIDKSKEKTELWQGSEHRTISVQKVENKKPETTKQQSFPKAENRKHNNNQTGYCIRTGVEIPFNIEKPMSYEAFKVWSQFGDPDYPEKFCHFSGEPSNGETSVSKPILKKNWKKAKEIFDF